MPLASGVADILATPAIPTVVQNTLGAAVAITYAIVAVNESGQDGIPSLSFTTGANNAATPNNTVSWVLVPGASAYRVIKNGTLVATVGAGVSSYLDNSSAAGATYTPVTVAPAAQLPVSNSLVDGQKSTYCGCITGITGATTGGDFFVLTGSASKTIRLVYMRFSGTVGTAQQTIDVLLVKRSTADSGGTLGGVPTVFALDSNNPTATGVLSTYTANPTMAGLVGTVRADKMSNPVASTSGVPSEKIIWDFGNRPEQAPVLRGVAQQVCIQLGTTPTATASFDVCCVWTEE